MTWRLPDPFCIDLQVQPDDLDGLGHVNNAVYVAWCEQVAWAHSESLGLGLADYRELNRAMAVRRSRFEYLAPAFDRQRLRLATWITGCERKLIVHRQFQIVRLSDRRSLLTAGIEFVCVDLRRHRPARMPDVFLQAYAGALVRDVTVPD